MAPHFRVLDEIDQPSLALLQCFVFVFMVLLLKAISLFLEPRSICSAWKGMFHF